MRKNPFVQRDPLGLNLGAIASDYVLSVGGFLKHMVTEFMLSPSLLIQNMS